MQRHDDADLTAAELSRRLGALEAAYASRARRERIAFALGGLALVLVTTAGATSLVPDTLAAKSFRLVDSSGAERAALIEADSGAVALSVFDTKGATAATLVLSGTEPLLSVIDAHGRRYAPSPVAAAAPAPAASPAQAATAATAAPAAEKEAPKASEPKPAPPAKRGSVGWGGAPADDDDAFDWSE